MVHNIFDLLYMCTIYYLETCLIIDIYIYIHIQIYIYIHIHIYIHIYIYTDTYIYILIYIDTYLYIYTDTNTHIYIYTYIYIYMRWCLYVGATTYSHWATHMIIILSFFFTCFFPFKNILEGIGRQRQNVQGVTSSTSTCVFGLGIDVWADQPPNICIYIFACIYLFVYI